MLFLLSANVRATFMALLFSEDRGISNLLPEKERALNELVETL
jgi:hypothetical protein